MGPTYETTWPVFVTIAALYVVLSLALGAKKIYFEPSHITEDEEGSH